jgi:hypothetical protein
MHLCRSSQSHHQHESYPRVMGSVDGGKVSAPPKATEQIALFDKVYELTGLIGGLIQHQSFQVESHTSGMSQRAPGPCTTPSKLRSCLKSQPSGSLMLKPSSLHRSVRFRVEEPSAQRPKLRDLRGKPGCTGCGERRGSHARGCFARFVASDPSQDRRGLRGCSGCGSKKGGHSANCEHMNQVERLGARSDVDMTDNDLYWSLIL